MVEERQLSGVGGWRKSPRQSRHTAKKGLSFEKWRACKRGSVRKWGLCSAREGRRTGRQKVAEGKSAQRALNNCGFGGLIFLSDSRIWGLLRRCLNFIQIVIAQEQKSSPKRKFLGGIFRRHPGGISRRTSRTKNFRPTASKLSEELQSLLSWTYPDLIRTEFQV